MNTAATPGIVIIRDRLPEEELRRLVGAWFHDMVKYVVDVDERIVAVGGELHADAEEVLLGAGCDQGHIWGANYYPGRGPGDCIEYTSLINISPSRGNRSMEIQDKALRERVRTITFERIGSGGEGWTEVGE